VVFEHFEARAKRRRNTVREQRCPRPIVLGTHAILHHRGHERIASRCAEGVVADSPVHAAGVAQITVQREFLERKHAALARATRSSSAEKENIEIEIKPAEAEHGEVAEKIEALDPIGK